MAMTRKGRPSAGAIWAAATTALVLLVSACGGTTTTVTTSPAPTTEGTAPATAPAATPTTVGEQLPTSADPAAIPAVEALFDAWNEGDLTAYLAVQSDDFTTLSARSAIEFGGIDAAALTAEELQQVIVDDFWYWVTIGTRWTVTDCEANPATTGAGDTVACDVEANTFFDRTLDEADSPTPLRLTVEEGVITFGQTDYIGAGGGYQDGAIDFDVWAREAIEDGTFEATAVPCRLGRFYSSYRIGQPPSAECTQWTGDHLEEWADQLAG